MCSNYSLQRMENYQGDLADIVRAIGGGSGGERSSGFSSSEAPVADWQFPANPMSYSSAMEEPVDDFGDPFCNLRDPLLQELDLPGSAFFNSSNNSTQIMKTGLGGGGGGGGGGGMFSRMLQISPNDKLPCESSVVAVSSPRGIKDSPVLVSNDVISSNNTSKNCLVENPALQISSPRSTGIKRRKSQAKKVVCIPAPAPANSRPSSGEVVPSDLWAWRKYGQKPIKGSPYPRGYYRCSSSKGCSARKQVERSRTDPNMLVITYTSEHNHPWPTQRNALAGSTRSQPSKTSNSKTTSSSSPTDHKSHNSQKETSTNNLKEERKETTASTDHHRRHHHHNLSSPHVKEEMQDLDKQIGIDDCELISDGFNNIVPQSNLYRPELPDSNNHTEDFFADLGEIEADPLTLLFTQGFSGGEDEENIRQTNKALLDPFSSLFDWTRNSSSSNNATNTSFGEVSKRGL